MKIIKRDGKLVDFDKSKIFNALNKANNECTGVCSLDLLNKITNYIVEKCYDSISVEQIQDLVVDELLHMECYELAKKYISYRAVREHNRNMVLERVFNKMGDIVAFGDNENSNKNYKQPSVARDTVAGEYFRSILKQSIGEELYNAHTSGLIHWHDGDYDKKLTNCCLANYRDMIREGTKINNAEIEKSNSVCVAMNVATQIMANISASQYGGVSLPDFNEVFAEYAKISFKKNFIKAFNIHSTDYDSENNQILRHDISINDFEENIKGIIDSGNMWLKNNFPIAFEWAKELTAKDIYDGCQLFEYQTNSVMGSASQTPFGTITFNIPTSWESEQIISSYFDVRMKGLGAKSIPAIFPKISMIVVDGYNLKKTDPYYYLLEKASKCIAKCYYPDILCYSKEDYDNGKYYARMGK